jgi:hypothetical protein
MTRRSGTSTAYLLALWKYPVRCLAAVSVCQRIPVSGKDMEGSGHGVIEELSHNFPGGTDNRDKP